MHLDLDDQYGKYFYGYTSTLKKRKNNEILLLFRRVADESSLDTPVRQLALGLCRFVFFGTL